MLWDTVRNQGWEGGTLRKADIARLAGLGFAAGMAVYNKAVQQVGWEQAQWANMVDPACAAVSAAITRFDKAGIDCTILAEAADLQDTLRSALAGATANDPTPCDWTVVAVEEPRPAHGNARADVVYVTPAGQRVVRDYKFSLTCDKKYVNERLASYCRADQAHHYLWMEQATTFIASLYVGSKPLYYEMPVTLEVDRWLASQKAKWVMMSGMKQGEIPVWRASAHRDIYGECPLVDYCLTHNQDPKALPLLGFVQMQREVV